MSETFLDKILETTRKRVSRLKASADAAALRSKAEEQRARRPANALRTALQQKDRINIVAEIKRASPSKGVINDRIDVREIALTYQSGGACAISVLTEDRFFKGSISDLETARAAVDLPILRKDFIIDPIQIYEAAAARSDAILLIVAALTFEDLKDLQTSARELGLDALVEVHTLAELETAIAVGASLIGVNNRNLHTFEVSLNVSRELIEHKPPDAVMIAESGISLRAEIEELRSLGFDGFLVGESLMRTKTADAKLAEFVA
jgi:indole-3-glycerol phosphate synthase